MIRPVAFCGISTATCPPIVLVVSDSVCSCWKLIRLDSTDEVGLVGVRSACEWTTTLACCAPGSRSTVRVWLPVLGAMLSSSLMDAGIGGRKDRVAARVGQLDSGHAQIERDHAGRIRRQRDGDVNRGSRVVQCDRRGVCLGENLPNTERTQSQNQEWQTFHAESLSSKRGQFEVASTAPSPQMTIPAAPHCWFSQAKPAWLPSISTALA